MSILHGNNGVRVWRTESAAMHIQIELGDLPSRFPLLLCGHDESDPTKQLWLVDGRQAQLLFAMEKLMPDVIRQLAEEVAKNEPRKPLL